MKLTKKAFTWSVVVMTILWSVGAAALAPMVAHAADVDCLDLTAGDLITFEGDAKKGVYLLNNNLEKLGIPSEATFASWFQNDNGSADWSGINTVPAACADVYDWPSTLPNRVSFRPGAALVKGPLSDTVYAVVSGNMRAAIEADVAAELYGADWEDMVVTITDVAMSSLAKTDAIASAMPHEGQLVTVSGSDNVYMVNDGELDMVDGEAAAWAQTVSQAVLDTLSMSGDTVTKASVVANPAQGTTVATTPETPAVTGALSVSLAANSPAASNVAINVDNVVFTKLVFSAGSDADVLVNSVKLVRQGLGAAGDFVSVTLFDGADKLGSTRNTPFTSSDDTTTYNISGGWTIPAGTSKTLTIVGKLDTAGTYNAVGVKEVTLGSGSVSGLPVYGNQMTGVNVSVGTVTITNEGTSAIKKIGTTDVVLAKFKLDLDSTEDGSFESITLKNKAASSNASDNDLSNMYLYKGTTVLAGPVDMESDEITFVLDEAFAIEKSENETFMVKGDIVNGDGNTVEFILNDPTDLTVRGDQYGTSMQVSEGSYDEATEGAIITIDGAELNIAFSSTAVDTTDDTNNVEFGTLTFSAGSTDIKITNMIFIIDETDGNSDSAVVDIDDLELVDQADGAAYSGTMTNGGDSSVADETWTYTDELYLVAGEARTFVIRGDIPASTTYDGDSYKLSMTVNTTNITAETVPEGDAVDNFSVGSITGKLVTTEAPFLTVRPVDLNNTDGVTEEVDAVLFKGTLEANDGTIHVERMAFEGGSETAGVTTTDATLFDSDNWASVGLYTWENDAWVQQELQTNSDLTSGSVDFASLSFDVPNGEKMTFAVLGTVDATLDSSNKDNHLQLTTVTAKDAENDAVSELNAAGNDINEAGAGNFIEQTHTLTLHDTGALYVSMRVDDTGFEKNRYVLAGEGFWAGKLRMKAEYEDIKIEDLVLTNDSADDEDSVASICLYTAPEATSENEVGCTTLDSDDDATFTSINHVVSGTQDLYIYVMTTEMGDGATQTADTSDSILLSITTSTAANLVARGTNSGDLLAWLDVNNSAVADGEIVFDVDMDGTFDEVADNGGTENTSTFTVAGSKITNVSLVSSYAGETVDTVLDGTGEYTAAIIKIETASNNNTDSNGDALKLAMTRFVLDVDREASTTMSDVTIERIGGTSSSMSGTLPASLSGDTVGGSVDVTFSAVTGTVGLDTDALINAGDTAYFVVKATVSGVTGTANETPWFRIGLDAFDSGTTNFRWDDGYALSTATPFTTLLLDTTNITGTKITGSKNN